MIRRRVGDEFWLIPQHDHGLVAGQLAGHFGNKQFARPSPFEETVLGTSLHDCGWPIHDEKPTLNTERLPLDVFETPQSIGLEVWSESARRAAARDPYAGLLVSLHSLSLSVFATSQTEVATQKFSSADMRTRFELNKFQHSQLELQESLRRQLGMQTDIPLKYGLAESTSDPAELNLIYNFRVLQAMDALSLCICCTKSPFETIAPLTDRPGGRNTHLSVRRPGPERLTVDPWPFDIEKIEVQIPFRRFRATLHEPERFLSGLHGGACRIVFVLSLASIIGYQDDAANHGISPDESG